MAHVCSWYIESRTCQNEFGEKHVVPAMESRKIGMLGFGMWGEQVTWFVYFSFATFFCFFLFAVLFLSYIHTSCFVTTFSFQRLLTFLGFGSGGPRPFGIVLLVRTSGSNLYV